MNRDFKVGDRVSVNYGPNKKQGGVGTVERGSVLGDHYFEVRIDHNNRMLPCERSELTHLDPAYAPGDRVRVTFEGTVAKDKYDGCISVTPDGQTETCLYEGYGLKAAKSIEVIERAKPEWADRTGVVVRSLESYSVWERLPEGWVSPRRLNAKDAPRSYEELINYTVSPHSRTAGRAEDAFTLLYDPAA